MRYTRSLVALTVMFLLTNVYLVFQSSQRIYIRESLFNIKKLVVTRKKDSQIAFTNDKIVNPNPWWILARRNTSLSFSNLTRNSVGKSPIVKKESFIYPEFVITEPNFINDNGKELFYKHPENSEKVGIPTKEKLIGEVVIVRRGTFDMPYDCGYRSNVSFVMEARVIPPARWYRSLVIMMVPDGGTFQHFLDGTLPKIIQSLDYIQQPQVKMLMPKIRDKIIFEILQKLNIRRGKIVSHKGSVGADYLVYTCVTPPLHPKLWRRARALLGVPQKLQMPKNEANIVIITRKGCFNCGRRLLNKEALISTLKEKYSNERVIEFQGPMSLNDTVRLFGSTSIIIGVHGGGLYNINFCPVDTTVIEIMPTWPDGNMPAAAHQIFWLQSVLLGHRYWRLPAEPVNSNGDVNVNATHVEDIIEKSWNV